MRTEPKASYRTVQYDYAYRYTPTTLCFFCFFDKAAQRFFKKNNSVEKNTA